MENGRRMQQPIETKVKVRSCPKRRCASSKYRGRVPIARRDYGGGQTKWPHLPTGKANLKVEYCTERGASHAGHTTFESVLGSRRTPTTRRQKKTRLLYAAEEKQENLPGRWASGSAAPKTTHNHHQAKHWGHSRWAQQRHVSPERRVEII